LLSKFNITFSIVWQQNPKTEQVLIIIGFLCLIEKRGELENPPL
jgi:hypothetical protein